ncbi:hypothetical protein [Nocardiopsis sp. NRRL B-16309]|uniref:hypothetical protein n=1 Tax=Nocardiopsis sp. NRRL B-16309 TaxID=1519494 RepID=UPI0006ADA857|nr:hypothetical protein [Nocardiopsis sp. NRRL B-16309]KOX16140.1 hypothetical protein ADL05_13150 [Nocardiopsis sp. NRRL B-16309]
MSEESYDRMFAVEEFMRVVDEATPTGRHGTIAEVARAVPFPGFEATFTSRAEVPVDDGLGWGPSPSLSPARTPGPAAAGSADAAGRPTPSPLVRAA